MSEGAGHTGLEGLLLRPINSFPFLKGKFGDNPDWTPSEEINGNRVVAVEIECTKAYGPFVGPHIGG